MRCGKCRQRFIAKLVDSKDSGYLDTSETENPPGSEFDPFNFEFADSLNSELSIDFDDPESENLEPQSIGIDSLNIDFTQVQFQDLSQVSVPSRTRRSKGSQGLIDEVDQLIEEKIVRPEYRPKLRADKREKSDTNFAEEINKNNRSKSPLFTFFIWLLITLLIVLLVYQLWYKHFIELPDEISSLSLHVTEPVNDLLRENLATEIPVRRHLSKLQLKSAVLNEHPTRASLQLLSVQLLNVDKQAQALPWLELTLTDEQGNIVARRNLSPDKYAHNNRTTSSINGQELKTITIELLSFPSSASGYELKIVDL